MEIDKKPVRQISHFAFLLTGLLFMSFAAIFIKSSNAPGIVTVFYRMFIAAIVLTIPFIWGLKKGSITVNKQGFWLAAAGGTFFGIDMALWSTGVVASNATLPTLTANLAPVWVGLASVFIFKEKHKKLFWLGLFLALAGVAALVVGDLKTGNNVIYGLMMGLFAGFFYAAFYLVAQKGRTWLSAVGYLYISTCFSSFVLFLTMLWFDYPFGGHDTHTAFMFLGISLGVQVIGWFFISHAQGFIPASVVAPTLLGQPVLTALWAGLLLNEKLQARHFLAGFIVVAGIYLVHFSRQKSKKRPG